MVSQIIRFKPPKKPDLRIGVIIAARMTSKRFPGKSMALLAGKPVIQWVMERAELITPPRKSKIEVVLAVPDTDDSEPMLELADKLKITNFCGDEFNVLKRYYDAAKFFGFDVITRITGDCPFIDPRVCEEILYLLIWRKLDYCSNVYPVRTYQQGLDCEVFTFDCLEAAYKLATTDDEKEHVTPWMQKHPEIKRGHVRQKINNADKNWCVDYPEDIKRLEDELANRELKLVGVNDQ